MVNPGIAADKTDATTLNVLKPAEVTSSDYQKIKNQEISTVPLLWSCSCLHAQDRVTKPAHATEKITSPDGKNDGGISDHKTNPDTFHAAQIEEARRIHQSRSNGIPSQLPDRISYDGYNEGKQVESNKSVQTYDTSGTRRKTVLLSTWKLATWPEQSNPVRWNAGDKALTQTFCHPSTKFKSTSGGMLISKVHTKFVRLAIRYGVGQDDAIFYVAKMYSGTAESNYNGFLATAEKMGKDVTLIQILEYMEGIYITPHTRRQAGDDISNLRISKKGSRVKAVNKFEDEFRTY